MDDNRGKYPAPRIPSPQYCSILTLHNDNLRYEQKKSVCFNEYIWVQDVLKAYIKFYWIGLGLQSLPGLVNTEGCLMLVANKATIR